MNELTGNLDIPGLGDVQQAHARLQSRVRNTPVLNDAGLDAALGCKLYCKCEHLQRTGAFKFRGANNAIARLRETGQAGDVATHSSGNHGAALALAASLDGRKAHVVMPENATRIKIDAVRRYGGEIHFCRPTQADREAGLSHLVEAGHTPIPPYDHFDIIAGQGTATLELLESHPELEVLAAPVGGGGLIGGAAIVAAHHGIPVFAAEPAGAADTAASMERGQRVSSWQSDTIADGLRALVGQRNFVLIRNHVQQVLTVSEKQIRLAMMLFWRHTRMLIEPSSAVVIAAIADNPGLFEGKNAGIIITGANIDPADWLSLAGDVQ